MSLKKLLEIRLKAKSKKPIFNRPESHKRMKLGTSWRRPRGLHSKVRLRLKGYQQHISLGYGSPREVKHLHKSGLKMIMVCTEKDVENINKDKDCAIIKRTVGLKKRIMLLKKLKEKNVKILNIKQIDEEIKKFEETRAKKKEKQETKKKEEKPKEKLEEKAATEEDKKANEKKEKDKLLIKRV